MDVNLLNPRFSVYLYRGRVERPDRMKYHVNNMIRCDGASIRKLNKL